MIHTCLKKHSYIIYLISGLVSTTPLICISMNNQACKTRPEILNVNSNEPVFYPVSIKTSKCTILVIIFRDILMFDKIFVSPQVKQIVIISNKRGIYELPNNLRLRTLGN